jgi:hypothetical protein
VFDFYGLDIGRVLPVYELLIPFFQRNVFYDKERLRGAMLRTDSEVRKAVVSRVFRKNSLFQHQI